MGDEQENKAMLDKIKELIPKEAEVSKVEFEGPDIAVYAKNIQFIYSDEHVIKNISASIKKRLIVRSVASELMDPEAAIAKIIEIVPKEAGIREGGIRFS